MVVVAVLSVVEVRVLVTSGVVVRVVVPGEVVRDVVVAEVVLLVRDDVRETLMTGPGRPKQLSPEHFRSKKLRTVSVCVWTL